MSGDRAGKLKTRWTKPPARCRGYGDSKSPNDAGLTEWMVELGTAGFAHDESGIDAVFRRGGDRCGTAAAGSATRSDDDTRGLIAPSKLVLG